MQGSERSSCSSLLDPGIGLLCWEGHDLVATSQSSHHHQVIPSSTSQDCEKPYFICDVCNGTGSSWCCEPCDFDICSACEVRQSQFSSHLRKVQECLERGEKLLAAASTSHSSCSNRQQAMEQFRACIQTLDSNDIRPHNHTEFCANKRLALAEHLYALERRQDAQMQQEIALEIYENKYGQDHLKCQQVRAQIVAALEQVNLVDVHFTNGNRLFYETQGYDQALEEYKASLRLCEQQNRQQAAIVVAQRHCCIARTLYQLKQYDHAVEACQLAVAVLNVLPAEQQDPNAQRQVQKLHESLLHLQTYNNNHLHKTEEDARQASSGGGRDTNLLGVSVSFLRTTFLAQVIAAGFTEHSRINELEDLDRKVGMGVIRQMGANQVSPADGEMGASFVHCLRGNDVGRANYMLSYSWSYSVGDIIRTLDQFCKQKDRDPNHTYIWLCCLCVNQHRVAEQAENRKTGLPVLGKVDFFAEFGERVTSIGHVIAMMTPWDQPLYLGRVWCLYEFHQALQCKCQLSVAMPPTQIEKLKRDLLGQDSRGISMLYEALGNTRVQDAKASVESDRLAILGIIQVSPGYTALNHRVNEFLRTWVKGAITEVVDSQTDTNDSAYAKFCTQIGHLWMEHGELKEALRQFRIALAITVSVGGSREAAAACHNDMGKVLVLLGKEDDALRDHHRALSIYQDLFGLNHVLTASCHSLIGVALCHKCHFDKALDAHRQTLSVFEEKLGEFHEKTAETHDNIGEVFRHQGNYDAATKSHEKALSIRKGVLGPDHVLTAASHGNVGLALMLKIVEDPLLCDGGDRESYYSKACEHHERALAIYESALGSNHVDYAKSLSRMGSLQSCMGNFEAAKEMIESALSIQESVLGARHVDTAESYFKLGSAYYNAGDLAASQREFHRAHAIYVSTLGTWHQQTTTCRHYCEMVAKAGSLAKTSKSLGGK
ncbi:Kinesin light chain [Seminavis robusta]|uniref:Kinesin light chain n=1 Tax=Seminavis robusta TaxID=568900 RepID=A0A9N8HWC7_9STRA|nr:Kinesin light chain [Seminavis robusta]|eukprot:Sro2181_g317990.1 Kinesin light chain (944) ;mRNA; r:5832-8750